MASGGDWREAFVATRVGLGAGVEEAFAELGEPPELATLTSALCHPDRTSRARALAAALGPLALAIEKTRLA